MIKPTIGRVVWYYPGPNEPPYGAPGDTPMAAIVCDVHSDRLVNLSVCDRSGHWHPRTSVPLAQPEDELRPQGSYCSWMPFQLGQAARTETAEARCTARCAEARAAGGDAVETNAVRGAPEAREPGEETTIGRLADSPLAGAGVA